MGRGRQIPADEVRGAEAEHQRQQHEWQRDLPAQAEANPGPLDVAAGGHARLRPRRVRSVEHERQDDQQREEDAGQDGDAPQVGAHVTIVGVEFLQGGGPWYAPADLVLGAFDTFLATARPSSWARSGDRSPASPIRRTQRCACCRRGKGSTKSASTSAGPSDSITCTSVGSTISVPVTR